MTKDEISAFCRAEGAAACRDGVGSEACPYPVEAEISLGYHVDLRAEWLTGWEQAQIRGVPRALQIMREWASAKNYQLHGIFGLFGVPSFVADLDVLAFAVIA